MQINHSNNAITANQIINIAGILFVNNYTAL